MIAPLQLVWTEQRTHSLNGKDNANVGHDLGQERMNKNCKQFVSAVVHDIFARLRMVASLLNAFFHIWPRFRRALGKKEKESYERADFKKSDKDKLLNALKAKLPAANYAALCASKHNNVFKSRPRRTLCRHGRWWSAQCRMTARQRKKRTTCLCPHLGMTQTTAAQSAGRHGTSM